MQYGSSPSYGKSDADDRTYDVATSLFEEMPQDYQDDWRDFRDRVMGKRH